ncbi:MAG TPA: GNAT family N-acetyltransferase [Phytomonospora sp.]
MELREATPDEFASWEGDWIARLGANKAPAENRKRATEAPVFTLEADGRAVGTLALSLLPVRGGEGSELILSDVHIAPALRGRGHGRAALEAASRWGREKGARSLSVAYPGGDEAAEALFGDLRLVAQHMDIELGEKRELPAEITVEPLRGDAYDVWHEHSVTEYARITAEAGFGTYEEAYKSSVEQFGELLPQGTDTPGHSLEQLMVDGEQVSSIWIRHGYEPGTSFVFDVESSAKHRGKGYGRAAMWHGENISLAAGDERLMLNVHGHNTVAISLYVKLGYRVVRRFRGADLTA